MTGRRHPAPARDDNTTTLRHGAAGIILLFVTGAGTPGPSGRRHSGSAGARNGTTAEFARSYAHDARVTRPII